MAVEKKTPAAVEAENKVTEAAEAAAATAKETVEKVEKAAKETVRKTAAKKAAAPKKAETTKKAAEAVKETVEKVEKAAKETVRKAAPKKAAKKTVILQYAGKEVVYENLLKKVDEIWAEKGKDAAAMKDVRVYVKPEENMAYYVVNDGEEIGSFAI